MTDGGKGSRPRPFSVSNEEYSRRWDAIFGRDQERNKESAEDHRPEKVDENSTQEYNSAK